MFFPAYIGLLVLSNLIGEAQAYSFIHHGFALRNTRRCNWNIHCV